MTLVAAGWRTTVRPTIKGESLNSIDGSRTGAASEPCHARFRSPPRSRIFSKRPESRIPPEKLPQFLP